MDDPKLVTVWVTKYALTRGLFSVTGELTKSGSVRVANATGFGSQLYPRSCYERDYDQAVTKRREMLERKIKNLRATLKRLEQELEDA
jgi:hypothetical protein